MTPRVVTHGTDVRPDAVPRAPMLANKTAVGQGRIAYGRARWRTEAAG
ncbi:hypothetical protein [Archangium sp.]|nr:hypothetical protein [Archangium sp.]